jgi:hypothetical protein
LAWALVHSREGGADVQRGIELAEALTDGRGVEQRDLLYLVAVGRYRQRKYIEARKTLKGLLEVGSWGCVGRWMRGVWVGRWVVGGVETVWNKAMLLCCCTAK